jgi:hypothetical protein
MPIEPQLVLPQHLLRFSEPGLRVPDLTSRHRLSSTTPFHRHQMILVVKKQAEEREMRTSGDAHILPTSVLNKRVSHSSTSASFSQPLAHSIKRATHTITTSYKLTLVV